MRLAASRLVLKGRCHFWGRIRIWATVEIYYLRQVRHQDSESPIVLQAFLFLHILTIIYLCLNIVLKRVHLDPHPWRSLFARVGAHLCFFARACLVLLRAAWAVSSTSRSFGKKIGFGMLWPLTAANLKIYPAGARAQNFCPSLQHTTNIHHPFRLFCDQSVTRGAFGKIFGCRVGYRSARAPSLQVTCVRDWMNSSPRSTKARPGSKTRYCMELATHSSLPTLPANRCMVSVIWATRCRV